MSLRLAEAAELQALALRQWNLIGLHAPGVAASALAPDKTRAHPPEPFGSTTAKTDLILIRTRPGCGSEQEYEDGLQRHSDSTADLVRHHCLRWKPLFSAACGHGSHSPASAAGLNLPAHCDRVPGEPYTRQSFSRPVRSSIRLECVVQHKSGGGAVRYSDR